MRIAVAGGTGAVGQHVVDVVRERGDDPVVLARSVGIDVGSGTGLVAACSASSAARRLTTATTQARRCRSSSSAIAARTVAERLVELAVGAPSGLVAELAGPRRERMARLVRATAAARGIRGPIVEIPLPGPGGRSMRDGTLLPGAGADLAGPDFDSWLAARRE